MRAEVETHQFLIALDQVGDAALAHGHPARTERLVDLGDAAMLTEAEGPDQGDHVQPDLPMRQGVGAFLLRAVRLPGTWTAEAAAPPHLQAQPQHTLQRVDRAFLPVHCPEGAGATATRAALSNERLPARGRWLGLATGHRVLPPSEESPAPCRPWATLQLILPS